MTEDKKVHFRKRRRLVRRGYYDIDVEIVTFCGRKINTARGLNYNHLLVTDEISDITCEVCMKSVVKNILKNDDFKRFLEENCYD